MLLYNPNRHANTVYIAVCRRWDRRSQVHLGHYYLFPSATAVNTNQVQELDCVRSVAHPDWSFITTQNDIALCFLNGRANFPAVVLADGGRQLRERSLWRTQRAFVRDIAVENEVGFACCPAA